MTGQQLRNSILQLAIQGKLVAQDPKEEPASALLKRIAEERAARPGKRKASRSRIERRPDGTFEVFPDGSEKDISGEIPFDIPKSWEWVRLGNYCQYGGVQSSLVINEPQDTWILDLEDIESQTGKILHYIYLAQRKSSSSKYRFSKGMVLYSKLRPYLNKVVVAEKDGYCTTEIVPVKLFAQAVPEYLKIVLTSPEYLLQINSSAYGVKMPRANAELLNSLLIPIPPSDEQHRIVAKIESLLPLVERYGRKQEKLHQLNEALPQRLRQSLLQAAIAGKLVAQDPKEEPASALLERIAKERAALPGKRKAAPPSRIERRSGGIFEIFPDGSEKDISDEIPFDIPESWEWVRLKYIFSLLNGDRGNNYPSKDKLSREGGIPFISAVNIQRQSVDNNNLCYLSSEQFNRLRAGKLQKGDIVICIRGSLGKYCFYPFEEGAIASSLIIARANFKVKRFYFQAYMETLFFYFAKIYKNGTAQPNLSASCLGDFLFPFPPDKEQVRIENYLKSIIETDMFKSIKSF